MFRAAHTGVNRTISLHKEDSKWYEVMIWRFLKREMFEFNGEVIMGLVLSRKPT